MAIKLLSLVFIILWYNIFSPLSTSNNGYIKLLDKNKDIITFIEINTPKINNNIFIVFLIESNKILEYFILFEFIIDLLASPLLNILIIIAADMKYNAINM